LETCLSFRFQQEAGSALKITIIFGFMGARVFIASHAKLTNGLG
jgi:hypothetical protein